MLFGASLALAGLVLSSCGSTDEPSASEAIADQAADDAGDEAAVGIEPAGPTRIGGTDLTRAEVGLEEVIFDTFDGGSIPLSEASEAQVARLLDAIPPIDEPRYQSAADAGWLDGDDLVIGYVGPDSGEAFAYPHRVLNLHELVAEEIDGLPLVVTYCPLCRSGVVFDRRIDHPDFSGTLNFGNTSALYNNDLVMIDRETESYWWQVAGRGIVGTLSGASMDILPSETVTWDAWREAHPDTQVLSDDQGFGRTYEDRFGSYADRVNAGQVPFPVEEEALADDRLPSAALVIGIEVEGQAYAVPVEDRDQGTVEVVDSIVVELDGRGGGKVIDSATGDAFPSRSSFWFAYLAAFPDVVIIES